VCEWVTRALHRHKSCWTMQYKPHRWFGTWLIRISIRHVPPHQWVKSISDTTSHQWSHLFIELYQWVISHINESRRILLRHVPHQWVTSSHDAPYSTSMSHVYINAPCHTLMSYFRVIHTSALVEIWSSWRSHTWSLWFIHVILWLIHMSS